MPVTKTCKVCMTQFQVPPVRAESALTCSRGCKARLFSQVRRDAWAEKTCPECGKQFRCPQHEEHRRKFCSRDCQSRGAPRGLAVREQSSGTLYRRTDGYVAVYQPSHPFAGGTQVLQHRLVMEEWLRETGSASHFMVEVAGVFYLRPEIVVHHRNEIKDDNARSNLVACTIAAHKAIHRGEPVRPDEAWPLDGLQVAEVERLTQCECKQCGKSFVRTPSEMRRGRDKFCSRECWDKSLHSSELPGRVSMNCQACGSEFKARRYRVLEGTARYCSNACRHLRGGRRQLFSNLLESK